MSPITEDKIPAPERDRALTEAVRTHRTRLLSFIRRTIRDRTEAEDVLQDVFEEYVEAYDLGQAIETLGAWLIQVARNKVIDRFRRRKSREDYEAAELTAAPEPQETLPLGLLRAEIIDALEMLPPEQSSVFIQHEIEGKSFEEIAALTGVGINTLLSRKRYAVRFLRKHLKEVYDELAE